MGSNLVVLGMLKHKAFVVLKAVDPKVLAADYYVHPVWFCIQGDSYILVKNDNPQLWFGKPLVALERLYVHLYVHELITSYNRCHDLNAFIERELLSFREFIGDYILDSVLSNCYFS